MQQRFFAHASARRFVSTPTETMSIPSASRVISEWLKDNKHDKWGWVFYRTTYNDDEAWRRFKDLITEQSRTHIAESDAPEIVSTLEWKFVEDRATLEGASKDYLRSRFLQWASEALKIEQPRVEDHRFGDFGIPRYCYFIVVDEGALTSVVYDAPQPPEFDSDYVGYVNFVDAKWKSLSELVPDDPEPAEDEVYEEIEGCTEENVGWMKIATHMAGVSFYQCMMDAAVWYVMYERPPEVVIW